MLLLVTNRRDITTDYIVSELKRRHIAYFRLNTELLAQATCTMDAYPRTAWSISLNGTTLRGEDVSAAYFRRPGAPVLANSVADEGERAYAEAEWSSFLKSLYARIGSQWLSKPADIYLAEDKPLQLLTASELGFSVPQSTITNDIHSVRSVTDLAQAIGKPLRQAVLVGERDRVMFTSRMGLVEDAHAPEIALAPFIVQEEIVKRYDVRVTVVGERVFATAIWSQVHKETEVDWRLGAQPDLRHERIDLPLEVEQQCIALVKRLHLRYGAIDLVCDRDQKLWFLEINPNGQWAWIENLTGYPIAAAIVDELEEIAHA